MWTETEVRQLNGMITDNTAVMTALAPLRAEYRVASQHLKDARHDDTSHRRVSARIEIRNIEKHAEEIARTNDWDTACFVALVAE